MVGDSPVMQALLERLDLVARTDATVLITGQSGVGKELAARLIHRRSDRSGGQFVTVNCASIPEGLFESEFFGHVKGAFTGAVSDRVGRFQHADGGTLFLDEVGEIPLESQGKLLRVLQNSQFERIGEDITREVDVRVVAATNAELPAAVESGRFRRDLFYRLSVFPIDVPPLRSRKEDILPLAGHFLDTATARLNRPHMSLTDQHIEMLLDYDWPGNVRELKSVMDRAVILSQEKLRLDLSFSEHALRSFSVKDSAETIDDVSRRLVLTAAQLAELERDNMIAALEQADWKISGNGGAADLLGLPPSTLSSRVKALGIVRPEASSLYLRLGGYEGIATFVNDLMPMLRCDPRLGRFWAHRGEDSIRTEKKRTISYFCQTTGGPQRYTGRDMHGVHRGMGVTPEDWQALLERVGELLERHNVGAREAQELLSIFNVQMPTIVEPD